MATYVFGAGADATFQPGDTVDLLIPGGRAPETSVRYLPDGTALIAVFQSMISFPPGQVNQGLVRFEGGSNLFVGGQEADTASGGPGADGLYGGQGDDSLAGLDGGDLLQGNQGRDTLAGGQGDDTVYGGQAEDVIDLGAGFNFAHGNMASDTITAGLDAGDSTLLGGQGADLLAGGAGADFLNGNMGPDTLDGGAGADTLSGEGGPDTFVLGAGSSTADGLGLGADVILDWSREDRLDAPGGPGAAYQETTAVDYAAARAASADLMGGGADVVAVAVGPDVIVFVDTDGGDAPDLAIRLVGAGLDEVGVEHFV